jgi:acetate---CoA ligase (ADP-forming)
VRRAGVKGLVVISAGFREIGGAGAERERELMEIVRRYGMRLVGPNCMGVLNSAPGRLDERDLRAHHAAAGPGRLHEPVGRDGRDDPRLRPEYGIGVSQFVSVGNKPDVSGNDLIQYWADDERTG